MEENYIPPFHVKRIKEFSFLINERLFELNKNVRVQFQHHTKFIEDANIVDLTLRVYYSYDTKVPTDGILVDFHVQNIFEISDLKQYKLKDSIEFILPENLIIAMVSVAISHLRALMAHNVAGTLYQDNIIPVVNPFDVASAFYPNMFKKTDAEKMNELTKLNLKNEANKIKKSINNTSDNTIRNKRAAAKK